MCVHVYIVLFSYLTLLDSADITLFSLSLFHICIYKYFLTQIRWVYYCLRFSIRVRKTSSLYTIYILLCTRMRRQCMAILYERRPPIQPAGEIRFSCPYSREEAREKLQFSKTTTGAQSETYKLCFYIIYSIHIHIIYIYIRYT